MCWQVNWPYREDCPGRWAGCISRETEWRQSAERGNGGVPSRSFLFSLWNTRRQLRARRNVLKSCFEKNVLEVPQSSSEERKNWSKGGGGTFSGNSYKERTWICKDSSLYVTQRFEGKTGHPQGCWTLVNVEAWPGGQLTTVKWKGRLMMMAKSVHNNWIGIGS